MARGAAGRVGAAILAAVLLAGCGGPITVEGVTIFRYGLQIGSPTALIEGTLRIVAGCVTLRTDQPPFEPMTRTILWPPSADLRLVDGRLGVGIGRAVAFDGDVVELGGGEQNDQAFVESLVGPVGECNTETYWMASSLEVVGR